MQKRVRSDAGIAIGVILFALAILAAISVAMSAGNNMMGSTIAIDRVKEDIRSQGLLIIAKVRECFTNGLANKQLDCSNNTLVGGVWSRSGCNPIDPASFYPVSTGTGTAIDALNCPSYGTGIQNLWTGQSTTMLPPPTNGFDKWYYVNAGDAGGRCIRIQPLPANVNDTGAHNGLVDASSSFSASELVYVPASASQRFILWITKPTGVVSADCSP